MPKLTVSRGLEQSLYLWGGGLYQQFAVQRGNGNLHLRSNGPISDLPASMYTWPHSKTTEGIPRLPNTALDCAVVCSLALLSPNKLLL